MPICPKCKNEYRDGFTVCAECKCDLVDVLQEMEEETEESLKEAEIALREYVKTVSSKDTTDSTEKKDSSKDGYKSGI